MKAPAGSVGRGEGAHEGAQLGTTNGVGTWQAKGLSGPPLETPLRERQSRRRPAVADEVSRTLHIERVLDAPRELVWEAWTDPAHAERWWGPKGFEVVYLEMDVRPGGAWKKCMRRQDGFEAWRNGVFRAVDRPERLAFTYTSDDPRGIPGHETLVTLTFEDLDGKTRLILHQAAFESVEARDSHQGGWTSTIERLCEYLTTSISMH